MCSHKKKMISFSKSILEGTFKIDSMLRNIKNNSSNQFSIKVQHKPISQQAKVFCVGFISYKSNCDNINKI